MLYARSASRALFRSAVGLAVFGVVAAGLELWDLGRTSIRRTVAGRGSGNFAVHLGTPGGPN